MSYCNKTEVVIDNFSQNAIKYLGNVAQGIKIDALKSIASKQKHLVIG